MTDKIGIAILAAGKGSRLKIEMPKALCPMLGKTLLDYIVEESVNFSKLLGKKCDIGVVVGHLKEYVIDHLNSLKLSVDIDHAIQVDQKGTADALRAYFEKDAKRWEHELTLVLCADTPLITANELKKLFDKIENDPTLLAVAASFETSEPTGYGRILKKDKGFSIIEEKDATEEERKITEVNSGLYLIRTEHIKKTLFKIDNKNKSQEFYLTDLFKPEYNVESISFGSTQIFQGINTLKQLEEVTRIMQQSIIEKLMNKGVRFINSSNCMIDSEVEIEAGSVIYPGVVIEGKTCIGKNVTIESGVVIKETKVGDNTTILANSYLQNCEIHSHVSIGPMARIRPGTLIEKDCKVGNFVEIKKSHLKEGAKVSHLSYVGDAEIGKSVNIGCGFITCNYDGTHKHKTIIGDESFIGSDCQMIAPVSIGKKAYIASGSTINKNVPDEAFAIARQRQETKPGMAKRFLKIKE